MMNENFTIKEYKELKDYRFILKENDIIYVIYFSFI